VPTFKPLKFSHSSLLGQNKYFGPPVFELYRHDSATRQYEKMAAFPFKKNGEKKNFIIFARNPKEMKKGAKPDLAFYEFSPETKKYPYESVTILNFTQHPISGSVNGVVCRGIGMSGQTVKASQFESGRKTIDIKLFRYDAENERVLPAYTAELINAKKTRFFVLLMPTAREFPFAADAALIIDAQPPTIAELKALADAEM